MVMTTVTDTGFVEMRLGKVVGVARGEGDVSCCVALDGVTEDRHLPIQIGRTEAFHLWAVRTGMEFPRPMSPQFAVGLLRALGGRGRPVRIDRLGPPPGGDAHRSTRAGGGACGLPTLDGRPRAPPNPSALWPPPRLVL